MPIYRFEFCHRLKLQDIVEIELADDAEAQRQAIKSAGEQLIDSSIEGVRPDDWAVRICNESGDLLWTIDFSMLPAFASGQDKC